MDVPTVLRLARQQAGLSQRALAEAAGLTQSELAKAETGQRSLRADVLDRVLNACGLDLELVERGHSDLDEDEHEALVRHLRLSLTERIYLALGGTGSWREGPWPDSYVDLFERPGVAVTPAAAIGVWLPGRVCHDGIKDVLDPDLTGHLVPVRIRFWEPVLVPTPLTVRAALRDPDDRRLLLAAATLLAMTASRDDGRRRPPPHRTPDEANETHHLMRSLTYAIRTIDELPNARDSRGWRLEQPVSLSQLLRRTGLPPRRGSQRRG